MRFSQPQNNEHALQRGMDSIWLNLNFPRTGETYSNICYLLNISGGTGRYKVSAKIQQLLNTLKRPKRRPLPEFYIDDDTDLEIAANAKDPNDPKPEGNNMSPSVGEPLVVSIFHFFFEKFVSKLCIF